MLQMRWEVDVSDAVRIVSGFERGLNLQTGLGDALAGLMREDARRQFEMGGDPAWQPLAESTIQRKRAAGLPRRDEYGNIPKHLIQRGHFGPENILIATGALVLSWTNGSAAGSTEEITQDAVEIGTTIDYASAHQFGEGVPQRPVVLGTFALEQMANRVLQDLVEQLL